MESLSLTFFWRMLIFCLVLAASPAAHATQTHAEYEDALNALAPKIQSKANATRKYIPGNRTSFGYFTNWEDFHPSDIQTATLTHILYAFADTDPSTGTIRLTNSFADETKHYAEDSSTEPGPNLYGCLKQLYLLKLKRRNLKVLLSIGGWNYSQAGHFNFLTNAFARTKFVGSAVQLIEDYGFDGIDIDYEYPTDSAQGQGLADLVDELRAAFDKLRARKGDSTPYLITAAVAATRGQFDTPHNYKVAQMNAALDYWNLMAYDYAGAWLETSDNQANLYGGERTGYQTDAAVNWYLANGASPGKINIGMPLYGHVFKNTKGLGHPFQGVGPEGGMYSYKELPLPGAQVYENRTDVSSYSYDAAKKELVSFDTPNIVKLKAQYINSRGLAGSMFWELSGDKVGRDSLVGTAATILGPLDQTPNHIHYPNSKWDNIRKNMAPSTDTSATAVSKTTTQKPKATQSSTTTTHPGVECAGVATWSSTTAYDQGAKVVYGVHLWIAKWRTQADVPGGAAGVWIDNGVC